MKFVALVSGGKDSCFNILHCVQNGHQLVALANLHPPETNVSDELDSWMYQTVGYQAVKKYDKVLGVPLYRMPISSISKLQSLEYTETEGDETEDLYKLLELVKKNHPDVTAVSSGAILSSYQRIRVENVCQRLGLTSLAFLWQRPQDELLYEIIDSGMNAIIVKTAAVGLNKLYLGKNLAQMWPYLTKLHDLYDLHMCGEGGEYETLVLGGPSKVFHGSLNITNSKTVDHSSGDVAYLSLDVEYSENSEQNTADPLNIKTPPLLDVNFDKIQTSAGNLISGRGTEVSRGAAPETLILKDFVSDSKEHLLNIVASSASSKTSIEDETTQVFNQLLELLQSLGKSTNHIAYISLLLASMDDFAVVNSIYKTYFAFSNPPARACIQVDGLPGRLKLSAILLGDANKREGLHVQSISYWAPANIGPYSQLISSQKGYSLCAGQIGLIPSEMKLPEQVSVEICLALQNLYRVVQVSNMSFGPTVAYSNGSSNVQIISDIWKTSQVTLQADKTFTQSQLLIVEVPNLPRNANVEWSTIGIDNSYWRTEKYRRDNNDEEDDLVFPPECLNGLELWEIKFGFYKSMTAGFKHVHEFLTFVEDTLQQRRDKIVYATIYTTREAHLAVSGCQDIADIVPANGLYDLELNQYEIAIVVLIET